MADYADDMPDNQPIMVGTEAPPEPQEETAAPEAGADPGAPSAEATPSSPYGVRQGQYDALKEPLKKLAERIIKDLEAAETAAVALRDQTCQLASTAQESYVARYDRETRRALNYSRISTDRDGKVILEVNDGYASCGLELGWTAQAVLALKARVWTELFNRYERTYILKYRANLKVEGATLERCMSRLLDHLLRTASYAQVGREIIDDMSEHGFAPFTAEVVRRVELVRDEAGKIKEKISPDVELEIKPISPINLTVSNPYRPSPQHQQMIFENVPLTSLDQLMPEEAKFEFEVGEDEDGIPQGIIRRGGTYTNLWPFKHRLKEATIARQTAMAGGGSQENPDDVASLFPGMGRKRGQGWINFVPYVIEGLLTPETAEYFGIDGGEPPKDAEPNSLIEWGVRCSRAPVTIEWAWPLKDSLCKHIIRLDQQPLPRLGNNVYCYRHLPVAKRFYSPSIATMGRSQEEMAGAIQNGICWTDYRNAHPNTLINTAAFNGNDMNQVNKAIYGTDQPIPIAGLLPDFKLEDGIKSLFIEQDEKARDRVPAMYEDFRRTVSISPPYTAVSGTSNTASEANLNKSAEDTIVGFCLGGVHAEQARMLLDILDAAQEAYRSNPEGFVNLIIKVSGEDATSDLKVMLGSPDPLSEQFDVFAPDGFGVDQVVRASILERGATTFAPALGGKGLQELAKDWLIATGTRNTSRFVQGGNEQRDPDFEHRQMALGNTVEPEEVLPQIMMAHISAHGAMQQGIEAGQMDQWPKWLVEMTAQDGQAPERLAQALAVHIRKTALNLAMVGGVPTAGGPGGGPANGNGPTRPKGAAGIAGDERGTASAVPGNGMNNARS